MSQDWSLTMENYKTCKNCQQIKPDTFEFFAKSKGTTSSRCILCNREVVRLWRLKNLQKSLEYKRKYYEENKQYFLDWHKLNRNLSNRGNKPKEFEGLSNTQIRRLREKQNASGKVSPKDVLEKYGSVCHICNEQIDLSAPRAMRFKGWERGLHFDHVIPVVAGGAHSLENIRPAHGICNLNKGYKQFLLDN
jgi:hypothetical protein